MSDEPDDDQPQLELADLGQNAADLDQLQKRLTARQIAQRESDRFWLTVFSTEAGRREMWGILTAAHTFEERFAVGPNGFPQSEATWFHAGEQAFGQRLYQKWLAQDPENVILMHIENDARFAHRKPKKSAK